MAKQQHDRENLLAEATALVERIEFLLPGYPQPAVAGFRRNGCASLFFGADPVYQFNSQRQLRRAYVDGLLYKAEYGRLASLTRHRAGKRLELVRHDLDGVQTRQILGEMHDHLDVLRQELSSSQPEILGQVPADGDVLARLSNWLATLNDRVEIASSAHAK